MAIKKGELIQKLRDFNEKKKQFAIVQDEFNQLKKEINKVSLEFFDTHVDDPFCSDNEILVESDEGIIKCKRIRTTKIDFDANKIEKLVPLDERANTITKTYQIPDWPKVVKLLKKYKVPAKEFIALVTVDKVVDKDKLADLCQLGYIDQDGLRKASTVTVKSDFVKVSELEVRDEHGTEE